MERFNFHLPVTDLRKAGKDNKGNDMYYFKGLASDASKDSDGESLDPSIFDFSEFKYVNWDHGKNPDDIIGEKTNHWVNKDGVMVEGLIYNQLPKGKATVDLMQALEKSPNGNRLGISVEGQVLSRHMVTKQPTRAKITSMAICPFPKNGNTWAQLMKKSFTGDDIYQATEALVYEVEENGGFDNNNILIAFVDPDGNELSFDKYFNVQVRKAQSTENSAGIIKEDVEGNPKTTLAKSIITVANAHQAGVISDNVLSIVKENIELIENSLRN